MKYSALAVFCAVLLLLASCSAPTPAPSNVEDRRAAESDTSLAAQTTDGEPSVTSETEAASTGIQIVTDDGGRVMTGTDGKAMTTIVYPSTAATTGKALDIAATPRRSDNTSVRPSTTTRRAAEPTASRSTAPAAKSSTTAKPTTTTKPPATTTAPQSADPWRYPYDLPAIYADCKREIERLGMVWEEELRPDNCAWANPESTVPNTYFPDDCYLRDDVFKMIRFYHEINTRRYCRIWFAADPDSPGDYRFYFLEEY